MDTSNLYEPEKVDLIFSVQYAKVYAMPLICYLQHLLTFIYFGYKAEVSVTGCNVFESNMQTYN